VIVADLLPVDPVRLRRWLKNVATSYADLAVGGLVFFLLTPLLVRHLGVEVYALWVVSHTITFYLGFLDLGLDGAHVRFHARLAAREHADPLRSLAATTAIALSIAGIVAGVLGGIVAFAPLDNWLDISGVSATDLRLVLLILAANLVVSFPASVFENVLEGAQRFDLASIRSIALRIVAAAAQLALLLAGYGIVELAMVELAMSVLRLIVDFVLASRLVPGIGRTPLRLDRQLWRRMRRFALWTSVDDVLVEGSAHLDKLILAALLPLALLTPYALCVTVASLLLLAVQPVVETFFPMAAGLHGERRDTAVRALVLDGSRTALALAMPAAAFLFFLGNNALELWTPEAASLLPHWLLPLLVVNLLVSVFLWTSTVVLLAVNRVRAVVWLTLAEVMLEVGLMIALTREFGLVGFALASLIANVAIGFGMQMPVLRRHLGIAAGEWLRHGALRVLGAGVPAAALAATIAYFLQPRTWLQIGGSALAIAAVYFLALAMFGQKGQRPAQLWNFLIGRRLAQ
jgi:O-antigen/teichoic acid export membrane protein